MVQPGKPDKLPVFLHSQTVCAFEGVKRVQCPILSNSNGCGELNGEKHLVSHKSV